jgi:aspartate/methionine/tyrosine aminotransferase
MEFPPFDLLEWFIRRLPSAEYDIGSSGMAGATLDEVGATFRPEDSSEGYPGGDPDLRQLLAQRYGVSWREVMVTAGASEANFLACAALLEAGDTVVVEHPTYTPLRNLPLGFGARTAIARRTEEDGWHLKPEAVSALGDFRLLVLANPNNPTGVMDSAQTMAAVGQVCREAGAVALVDEIFLGLVFDGPPPSVASLGEEFLVTSGLSKLFGLGGLRIGWAVGPREIIEKMERVGHHASVAPSHLSERVALAALHKEERFVERARRLTREARPVVDAWIGKQERVTWVPPDVGNFGYPRVEGVDATALAEHLAKECNTVIAPGEFFGHSDRFRLGFGTGRENVEGGLANLTEALEKF